MKRSIQERYDDAEVIEAPAPLPLRRAVAAAAPYPLKALGKLLEGAARAIMDKVQCPDAIAAQAVLGAAALATQAHVDVVHPATGEVKPTSLFLVTVAASGERKSAADRLALGPIALREAELREQYEREHRLYLDASAVYERTREQVLKSKDDDAMKREHNSLDCVGQYRPCRRC